MLDRELKRKEWKVQEPLPGTAQWPKEVMEGTGLAG